MECSIRQVLYTEVLYTVSALYGECSIRQVLYKAGALYGSALYEECSIRECSIRCAIYDVSYTESALI